MDLHTFGFRPDLSRRSVESRMFSVQGREQQRTSAESVAIDVSSALKENVPDLGKLASLGLHTFQLYATAYGASEPLAEHLLAGAMSGRDSNPLIVNTLKAIYSAPSGWVGNETLNAALMVLRVLVSIPDERQTDRISYIMNCNERPAPHIDNGVGLLVAARAFYTARSGHTYPNEIHYAFDRYVGILKELLGLNSIFRWMTENRQQWTWIERELLENPLQVAQHQGQGRNEYAGHREGEVPGVPVGHHHPSDSEGVLPGMHDDSEDEDDDFDMDTYHDDRGPNRVIVEGAGNPAVNGVYAKDGYFERVGKFSRPGEYDGKPALFSLFQCNVSNNTKHWYISVVPSSGQPGTSADLDFYSAPVTENCRALPPQGGWTKANEGRDPSPTLVFKDVPETEPIVNVPGGNWSEPAGDEHDNGGRPYV